jgi:outer membrane protein OmpA-like peptidoglycan-associated protein
MAALDRILGRSRAGGEGEGAHWLSVSDLMAGLMMVFLFIAIALMRSAFSERDQIREIAVAYQENQVAIYQALVKEFERDLTRWDASIDQETLSFEFRSPDVLFAPGATVIRPRFQQILEDFFPRYLEILRGFKDSVNEIRVEGHTSSDWAGVPSETEAYFLNMALSQGRTRSVLRYVYELPGIEEDRDWVKQTFAAVGFSSSRLALDAAGQEDRDRSRRVTFRVITNAETQIRRILEEPQG